MACGKELELRQLVSKEISFKSVGVGDSGQLIMNCNIISWERSTFYLNYRSLKHTNIRKTNCEGV